MDTRRTFALRCVLWLMAAAVVFSIAAAAPALGEEPVLITVPEITVVPKDEGTSGDAAAGYISKQMTGGGAPTRGNAGFAQLEGNDARLYTALKPLIAEVAAGQRSSTEFEIPVTEVYDQIYYTFEELGAEDAGAAKAAFLAATALNLSRINSALLVDCPYELYWFDKTKGTSLSRPGYYTMPNTAVYYDENSVITVSYRVSAEYSVSGAAGTYDMDTSWGTSVQQAAANARAIVTANAGLGDIAKLTAYKDAICGNVDYNFDALQEGTAYGNPWQLVWVFDDDPSTKVVCEGYSKAFQFLCDESSFSGNTSSIIVTGTMQGGTGAGGHMWNVVTLDNGRKYLADVTNSDAGSVGQDGGLFLDCYTEKSVDEQSGTVFYTYQIGSQSITYWYDSKIIDLYGPDDLTLPQIVAEGTLGDDITWALDDTGLLTLEGTGPANVASADSQPWYSYRSSVASVYISEGITSLGANLFSGLSNMESISLPAGLGSIGTYAFNNCTSLQAVDLPDGLTAIGDYAFVSCHALTGITIPDSVTDLGANAFSNCHALASAVLGSGVTALPEGTFNNCESLADVTFRGTLTSIGAWAFSNGDSNGGQLWAMSSFTIPDSVTSIGAYAFNYQTGLTEMTLPASVEDIGSSAFRNCAGLTSVTVLNRDAVFGTDVFKNCGSMTLRGYACSTAHDYAVGSGILFESIPGGDHEWGEVTYAWSTDLSTATASRECARCGCVDTETVGTVSVTTKEPGCETMGETTYTAEFKDQAFETQTRTETDVQALGHDLMHHDAQVPTCTEPGWDAYDTCSRCGYTTYEAIGPLGHELVDHNAQAPTCTEAGWDVYETCTRCDYTTLTEIPALGHELEHHDGQVAACTQTGWKDYDTCTRCDYTTYEAIDALGHDIVQHDAQAPTCTEAGWDAYETCTRCDYTTFAEKAALGHELMDHNAQAPTCTEAGWDAYETCTRCDYTTLTEIPALGHELEHHDGQAATCTQIGWEAYETCTRCDHTTYAEIDALGHDTVHNDAKAPTCTEIGWDAYETCTRCDYTTYAEKAALGHDVRHFDAQAPTCTEAGWDAYDACVHAGCDNTTYSEIPALGHDTVHHDAQVPTCTDPGWDAYDTCTRCDYSTYEVKAALGHDWSDVTYTWADDNSAVTASRKCGRCDREETETAGTTFAVTKAATCEEKGETTWTSAAFTKPAFAIQTKTVANIPATGHTEVTLAAKAPTCTETGLTEGKKCSVCGKILSAQQTVPAKGHTAVTVPAVEPTYTSTGLTEGSRCSVCGAVLVAQQVVPKKDEPGKVTVNAAAFPDDDFRAWVTNTADTNRDGKLTDAEIAAVKTIDLSAVKTVEKLDGIETFTDLENLDVSNNKLTELDVTKLVELKTLKCDNNRLTSLDLSKNTKLTTLTCTGNVYTVKVKAGIFDLSTLKGFDASKASAFSGGKVSGTTLTALQPGNVTYTYDCGMSRKATFTLKLEADPVAVDKVTTEKTSYAYTGKAVEPELTVTAKVDGKEITLDEAQYEVEYTDNLKAGMATVKVTGKGFFKGSVETTFEITPVKLSSATLKYTKTTYTGKALKPDVTVKAKVGGKTVTLKKTTDYAVTYKNNTNAGKATVTVKGKGNFTGTLTKTFTITGAPLTVAKVKNASLPYNGKAKTPILIVKAKVGTKTVTLKKDRDYTATYKNNVNAGTATVTVKGKGNYSGTMTATFKINPLKLKNAKATLSDTTLTYTGKALKPKVTVTMKVGTKTVTLKSGTDYTVTYKNNKKVGTATVTITGKGNFTGTITLSFNIVKK